MGDTRPISAWVELLSVLRGSGEVGGARLQIGGGCEDNGKGSLDFISYFLKSILLIYFKCIAWGSHEDF